MSRRGRSSRSRREFSNSLRVIRRNGSRCPDSLEDNVNMRWSIWAANSERSSAPGWLFFLGGISDCATASWILIQVGSCSLPNWSALRSNPPFLESESWQSRQYFSKNGAANSGPDSGPALDWATKATGKSVPEARSRIRRIFRGETAVGEESQGLICRTGSTGWVLRLRETLSTNWCPSSRGPFQRSG